MPSSTENLALIREFVSSAARQAGFDEKEVGRLELAVDEACANVIEHAYGHDANKEVIVRAKLDENEFSIDIEDTGKGFDPGTVNQEELEQLISKRKNRRTRNAPDENPDGRSALRNRTGQKGTLCI